MGMGFAPTWLRQVSHLLHKKTLTTGRKLAYLLIRTVIAHIECSDVGRILIRTFSPRECYTGQWLCAVISHQAVAAISNYSDTAI